MRDIRIATAQFEHRDNDKSYNLGRVRQLTQHAVEEGAEIVSFHECAIPGYSWLQPLDKEQLLDVAEPVPSGESLIELVDIARGLDVIVMAGLLERDEQDNVYNAYVVVDRSGVDSPKVHGQPCHGLASRKAGSR